jgi:hypothetical protein
MGKYTFRHIESHKVDRIHALEFDTKDQALWERMRELAIENDWDLPDEPFPENAPDDPAVWYELLKCVPESELGDVEEDWWQLTKGGYDVTCELLDSDGGLVVGDE